MPYLVSVTGNRFPIRRGQSYILGRGLDCDVVVEDGACSRRHARLTMARATDAAFLEDLGSRNGSFLNGELVRSRTAVREGSRIQIGASIFLVRLKDEREEIDLQETGTIAFDWDGFRRDTDGGELGSVGIVGLLRHLFNGKRSVRLHIALDKEHAIVEVRQGEILYADYSGLGGFNALVRLGRNPNGIFWMVDSEEPCGRNINDPTVRLLNELQRCLNPSPSL